MCDTLAVLGSDGTLFAKNSDRPVSEVQLIEAFDARPRGGQLRTQYLEIDDAGAAALLGSRPEWLWGFEHGVNEHRVAIGNEKVYGTTDPYAASAALIGMDLVRLGLERSRSADEALETMTALLDRHGQGGVADNTANEPYWSSFLVADPAGAWILETDGDSWAARPVEDGASISNRHILTTDWTRASTDVAPGTDWDVHRNPDAPTGHADRRLDATRSCVATGAAALGPRDLAATMRHHGGRPWGAPGADPGLVDPLPEAALPDGTGVTVCMHVRAYQATTSSMVCELPSDPDAPLRAWVAPGSPCVSVYLPVFPPVAVPKALGQPETWQRFAVLRDRVERDGDALAAIRARLAPVEAELWDEADELVERPDRWSGFVEAAWHRVDDALAGLS